MSSEKEKEILARQRALAAKLSGIDVPKLPEKSASSKSSTSTLQTKQQQALLAQANQRKKLQSILSTSSSHEIIRPTNKRPTLKTKANILNKTPTNAASVLSVARQRLGIPKTSNEAIKKVSNKTPNSIQKHQRKPTKSTSQGLASILSRSSGVDAATLHQKVRNYPALVPDEYWKNEMKAIGTVRTNIITNLIFNLFFGETR